MIAGSSSVEGSGLVEGSGILEGSGLIKGSGSVEGSGSVYRIGLVEGSGLIDLIVGSAVDLRSTSRRSVWGSWMTKDLMKRVLMGVEMRLFHPGDGVGRDGAVYQIILGQVALVYLEPLPVELVLL